MRRADLGAITSRARALKRATAVAAANHRALDSERRFLLAAVCAENHASSIVGENGGVVTGLARRKRIMAA